MKKVIRLTESDLINIIKSVIKEENSVSVPSGGITINGVNISVSKNGKGHLIFKSKNFESEYKVTASVKILGIPTWSGNLSVKSINKYPNGKVVIIDNTGKDFDGEDTDLIPLIKQFNNRENQLQASIGQAKINLKQV
jgi:hypothetical protein